MMHMTKEINFIELDDDKKMVLLDILGFSVKNGVLINKESRKAHICKFTNTEVTFENASILPWNSSIIVNTTPLSLSKYFSEYKELKNHND